MTRAQAFGITISAALFMIFLGFATNNVVAITCEAGESTQTCALRAQSLVNQL